MIPIDDSCLSSKEVLDDFSTACRSIADGESCLRWLSQYKDPSTS